MQPFYALSFPSREKEAAALICNYSPVYTDSYFVQEYTTFNFQHYVICLLFACILLLSAVKLKCFVVY